MNKPLLAGAGITLVALGVAPYFIGSSVEDNINAAVNELNEQAVYSAEVLSYDKGWFSTTAEIKLAVDFQALVNAQNVDAAEMPIEENGRYHFQLDAGFIQIPDDVVGARGIPGTALLSLSQGEFTPLSKKVAKVLCRDLLKPLIGDKPLKSRELFMTKPR